MPITASSLEPKLRRMSSRDVFSTRGGVHFGLSVLGGELQAVPGRYLVSVSPIRPLPKSVGRRRSRLRARAASRSSTSRLGLLFAFMTPWSFGPGRPLGTLGGTIMTESDRACQGDPLSTRPGWPQTPQGTENPTCQSSVGRFRDRSDCNLMFFIQFCWHLNWSCSGTALAKYLSKHFGVWFWPKLRQGETI